MRVLASAILMSVLPLIVYPQSRISGNITDEAGQPLIGANVYVEKTFQGAIADIEGAYLIRNLRNGSYIIRASYMGYNPVKKEVDLQDDTDLNFVLTRANVLAEEVIVSATRAGDRSPVAFSNISKEEIKERNLGQDIPILLNLTPSMVATSDAGTGIGYTNFRIRGSDMNRVNVTINGIPLNDSESHGVWWVNMPDFAASVDNIQIQRGLGTSSNGAAAFGATLNFQTFTMNPEPHGEFTAVAGTFNTRKTSLSVGTGMLNDRFTIDMRLSKIYSDGYIDRASSDLKSFSLTGAYYAEKSLFKINIFSGVEKTYQAWWGVPSVRLNNDLEGMQLYELHGHYTPEQTAHMIRSGSRTYNKYTYDNETDNYQQDHYQLFYSRELGRQLVMNMGLHYTYGRGYYEQHRMAENLMSYGIDEIITGTDTIRSSDMIRQKWLDNDFFGVIWSLNYRYGKLDAYLGGGWNHYEGRHFGKVIWARNAGGSEINHEWYRNKGVKRDWSTYLKINYKAGNRFSLYGDLQYRSIWHDIEGIDDDLRDIGQKHVYQFPNPKAGAILELSNQQRLAASVSAGHREPNRDNFVDANPARPLPEHEALIDYEVSYRINMTKSTFEANFYYMDYDNQLILTGEINDVGNPVMTNMKDSYRTGIELIAGILPTETLQWDLNLTISRNRIRNYVDYVDDWDNWPDQVMNDIGETDISFSPSVIGGSKIIFEPVEGFKVSLMSKYVGKQYIDNSQSEEHKLDPYFVNDLQLQYTLHTNFLKEIRFNLLLNNVFDVKYESNAWVYKYFQEGTEYKMDGYFPQAGFNFLAGMTVRF